MNDSREKTYRSYNCKRALLPRLVLQQVNKEARILDLGCGKDAFWVEEFRKLGYEDVEGVDLSLDTKASGYYDVIMLSNVVNVQESMVQISKLALYVAAHSHAKTRVFFNVPTSPIKSGYKRNDLMHLFAREMGKCMCSKVSRIYNPKFNGCKFDGCSIVFFG